MNNRLLSSKKIILFSDGSSIKSNSIFFNCNSNKIILDKDFKSFKNNFKNNYTFKVKNSKKFLYKQKLFK